jgi:adenylate kinase family enzyme
MLIAWFLVLFTNNLFTRRCFLGETIQQLSRQGQEILSQLIIFGGPPGGGKTTQGKLAAHRRSSCVCIDTSDELKIINASVEQQTEVTSLIKEKMSKGFLVDDSLVNALMKEKVLAQAGVVKEVLVCGYPRTMDQFNFLASQIIPAFHSVLVLHFEAEELGTLKDRMLQRNRHDDKPGVIDDRLVIYDKETRPAFEQFALQGYRVCPINAVESPEEVYQQIVSVLGALPVREVV